MKRVQVSALVSLCVSAAVSLGAATAHAVPKKKAATHAEKASAPQSAEIRKAMGDLKWGESRDAVLGRFMNVVKERYRPKIAKATGAIEEDKLRAAMRDELSRIKESLVEFDGKKTGWDVSFLKGEFTHDNGESLLSVNDDTSQNYYFFIDGKLWKWIKAFNAATFQGKTFDQFADAIQARYGVARRMEAELAPGEGKRRWLEWQDGDTRLRAIDNTQFYGFYCLVFDHKGTLAKLPELRTAPPRAEPNKRGLVDAVTSGAEGDEGDSNQDVVDRITGKIRVRQDAPEEAPKKGAAGAKAKPGAPGGKAAPTPDNGRNSDDPLRGL